MKTSRVMTKLKKPCRKQRMAGKAYSSYIYRLQKEDSPTVNKFAAMPRRLTAEMFAQVGAEAARLSKFNKRGTITQREVHFALHLVHSKINARQKCA